MMEDKILQAQNAIKASDKRLLLQLLSQGLDPDSEFAETTLLIEAIVNKERDIVALLLDNGADINKGSSWLVTPLCAAAATNNIEMTAMLLKRGCDIGKLADNRPVCTVVTPLHYAIDYNNISMAKLLLDNGHNPNFPSNHRYYPIIEAIKADSVGIVRLLLNTPTCMTYNIKGSLGGLEYPPLYQALFIYRKYHIAEEILSSRRCLLTFMGDSYISLTLRRAFDNSFLLLKTTKILLEAGCDMECKDRYQYTPFMTLVKANRSIFHINIMKPLMSLFVQAGVYPTKESLELLHRYTTSKEDHDFVDWLTSTLVVPPSLTEHCRKCLRLYFGVFPKDRLLQLPLPQSLLNYLSLLYLRPFYG